VILVAGLAAAWWVFWSARLTWPTEDLGGVFGISVPSTDGSRSWTFAESVVCLEGVDSAVVDSIEVGQGNARVTDFAVRPRPALDQEGVVMLFGSRPGPLWQNDFGPPDRTIDGRCAGEAYTEVAVELTRPTQETARADGLLIHWSAGIRRGTLLVPGHFVVCTESDVSAESCQTIP
jgi:hypothetical protein